MYYLLSSYTSGMVFSLFLDSVAKVCVSHHLSSYKWLCMLNRKAFCQRGLFCYHLHIFSKEASFLSTYYKMEIINVA